MKIDDIMNRLSKRNLRILIALLSVAIIVLAFLFWNKYHSSKLVDDSPKNNEKPSVVVIDPGHGGWEPGAGNGSINEKDVVLSISLEVEKQLKEKKIDYYMIRDSDTYVSLEDRVKIANEKNCKLFVSIHNNSFSDSSQGGILTTYNPYSPIGKEIAQVMQSKLADIGMRNRDIMPRPNLYVLRKTEMPSVLLEIGFISNKKDLKLLTDSSFQKKCAKQIVLGIEEILSKYITAGEAENSSGD
jgi:N-acetylmuramoyl-L-alanine amidase